MKARKEAYKVDKSTLCTQEELLRLSKDEEGQGYDRYQAVKKLDINIY